MKQAFRLRRTATSHKIGPHQSTEGTQMHDVLVKQDRHEQVRLLTFNRPAKKNAFNNAMYLAAADALRAAQEDAAVREIVFTGAGDAFFYVKDFTEMNTASGAEHGFPRFMQGLVDYDKPIVTAVNGVGIGLGLTMLLHTDVNYVADHARLRVPFVTLGVVPEAASSYLLPLVVGPQRAAEILFTARWITAAECVDLGLALAVVPRDRLLETALAKASEIAAHPPDAVRHTKRLLRVWRRGPIAKARQREDEAFQQRLGSPENLAAIQAFFERPERR
jgi:enoyl-CoA hydratase/carnithine racemase